MGFTRCGLPINPGRFLEQVGENAERFAELNWQPLEICIVGLGTWGVFKSRSVAQAPMCIVLYIGSIVCTTSLQSAQDDGLGVASSMAVW
jgi:hypothetical protein